MSKHSFGTDILTVKMATEFEFFLSIVCHVKKNGTFYTANDENFYMAEEIEVQKSDMFMFNLLN